MVIKLGNKTYVGQCNALSYIFHNRIFRRNIIEELNELRKCFAKLSEETTEENTISIYNILIRIIYTLMYTYNSNIYSFNNFKEEIKDETITLEAINEVIEILIISFTDEEVYEILGKISDDNTEKSRFPEHDFLVSCLKIKLTVQDLKILTYIDVIKMLISTLHETKKDKNCRKATQADIDNFM